MDMEIIDEVSDECPFCGGDGWVSTDERDSDGNIERGVGRQKCICQIDNETDEDDDSDRS